jgi:hypothetical protein
MKLKDPSIKALDAFLGRLCLIFSNNGQHWVGKCMGLSTVGMKDFIVFIGSSGKKVMVNISYLESLEVIDEDWCETQCEGKDPGVACDNEEIDSLIG